MSRKAKSSDERRFRVAPEVSTEVVGERASSAGVLLFSAVLFAAVLAVVLGAGLLVSGRVTLGLIVAAALAALLAIGCCHIAQQWERVVVLRLGRFNRVSGPGLFWTIPVIESNTMRVDTRTRVTTFYAEETLTADLVPMNVDAVLFWHVWDAAAACTEVGDFTRAVEMAAQTALRDAIGRASAAEVAIRREQLEAQAEQRKKARIILIEAEHDIYEILDEMEELIGDHEAVARLRTMHLLNESLREGKGTVVIPSAFAEGFNEGVSDLFKG